VNARRDRSAARLGLVGGALGVVAGLVQAVAGRELGSWAGDKADPVPLGLLTVALSAVAVAAGLVLYAGSVTTGGRRAALVAGLAVPGLMCLSTVGRLWWIPGALLLLAAGTVVAAAPTAVARAVADAWLGVLTTVLGACFVVVAATARPVLLVFGAASGLAVAAAPWLGHRLRPVALLVLVLGAVPFAAITWWTLLTLVIAVLALVAGLAAIRDRHRHSPAPNPVRYPR